MEEATCWEKGKGPGGDQLGSLLVRDLMVQKIHYRSQRGEKGQTVNTDGKKKETREQIPPGRKNEDTEFKKNCLRSTFVWYGVPVA